MMKQKPSSSSRARSPVLHPAVDEGLGGGLGLVPVALHHLRALAPELADLADRQLAVALDVMIFRSVTGTGGRNCPGGARSPPRLGGGGEAAVSVMPQPLPACDFGKVSLILRTSSGGRGRAAVGDALRAMRGRSSCARRMLDQLPGDGRHAAGRLVIFSRSISSKARNRVPAAHQSRACRRRRATGSGRDNSRWRGRTARPEAKSFCGAFGSGAGGGSPRRRKLRARPTAAP